MYAVIRTGGKQYRVTEGAKLRVERLEAEAGSTVDLTDVMLVADGENVTVGDPLVKGAKVTAKVLSHGRGPKIRIIKFRRRKHHQKATGHRQAYTELSIDKIAAGK